MVYWLKEIIYSLVQVYIYNSRLLAKHHYGVYTKVTSN